MVAGSVQQTLSGGERKRRMKGSQPRGTVLSCDISEESSFALSDRQNSDETGRRDCLALSNTGQNVM